MGKTGAKGRFDVLLLYFLLRDLLCLDVLLFDFFPLDLPFFFISERKGWQLKRGGLG
jgi:hypothetical protein